jgi:capsular polysaccharide biosynthesis protein
MEKTEKMTNDYYVVDLSHIVKVVWRNVWVVAVVSILVAAMGFSLAAFLISPTYSSSIMLYVNNSSFNVGDLGFSITSSELTAAQSLAKTYTVLLKNRTTLERVIDETGVSYTWEDVYDMIDSAPVNETEVIQVTVTCEDPYEAELLANGIAVVLPQRIAEVIEGASMEVVDSAIVDTEKVAPSITMYTVVGFIVGMLLAVAVLIISALMDNTVHDEDYVIQTYNYPILAKVPNLLDGGSKTYGYYNRYYKYKSYSQNSAK